MQDALVTNKHKSQNLRLTTTGRALSSRASSLSSLVVVGVGKEKNK
jgi:hypothetical protein